MSSDIRYLRKFIAVYEQQKNKRLWRADFFNDKDAIKYIQEQAPELQPKLNLYEGYVYTDLKEPLINKKDTFRAEAVYFVETNQPINRELVELFRETENRA